MKPRKQKIDIPRIVNHTHFVKVRMENTISLAEKFKTDPDKKERHKKQECPVCFYINSRMGGAMMTTVVCATCDEVMRFSNTSTDILCLKCAKRTGLCRHCGADVDVKERRKFNL